MHHRSVHTDPIGSTRLHPLTRLSANTGRARPLNLTRTEGLVMTHLMARMRGCSIRLSRTALALLALAALPHRLPAQSVSVSGSVTDAATHLPLAEALITVVGTAISTYSNNRGHFTLAGLTGPTVSLRASRLGYKPVTVSVPAGETEVVITLTESALKLDELVVTGQAGDTRKRALGNSVGIVNMAADQQTAPSKQVLEALSVAVPGVQVQRASGQLGTGGVVRIRGLGSLSLSGDPIVFIDGVRADNSAGSNSIGFQGGGDRPSRINDIDPDDIESIQVLKGPSASTLYGTEASNGVIQIITKRGAVGRPIWSTELRAGANWLPHPEKVYDGLYFRNAVTDQIDHINLIENDEKRGFGSPFSTGTPLGGALSLSGGTDQVKYYFTGSYDRDEGIVSYNWQNKFNAAGNLSYTASDKLKVDLNLGFTRSKTRSASAFQPMTTFLIWGCPNSSCQEGSGVGLDEPGRGYLAGVTPETFDALEGFDNIDRSRVGLTFNHNVTGWLSHRLTLGGDFTGDASSLYSPRGATPVFGFPLGVKVAQNDRSDFLSADYSATANAAIGTRLTSSTSGGVQYYAKKFTQNSGQGQNFPIRGVNTVGGGGIREGFEDPNFNFENKTLGIYGQEQLSWNDRLFVTGAVRGDDNSAFGSNYNFVVYPKVSAAWVISEEPFLKNTRFLSTLKLRAAWGEAGQAPNQFAAVQTYGPSSGDGGVPTVTPLNFGNANLRPEIGREFEGGFDAGLFTNRVTLEATYYNKVTTDAIVAAPVSASSGFPGIKFVNLGQISNRGFEFAVSGSPVNSKDFHLNLRASLATNRNNIDRLGADAPIQNTSIGQLVGSYNANGNPLGSFFLKKVVGATLVSPGVVTDVTCEGGTNFGKGNGTVVPCASAPLLYAGQPIPRWLSAFSADVNWKQWRLVGVVEFQGGHQWVDGNLGAANSLFINSKEAIEGTNPILVAYQTVLPDQAFVGTGLMNAGFGKLRNLSLSYEFTPRIAKVFGASRGSITLTGANLFTLWRAQRELYGAKSGDPEVKVNSPSFISDSNLSNGFSQESWPQYTRFLATFRLTY